MRVAIERRRRARSKADYELRRRARSEPAMALAGTTEFTADPELMDPVWVVQALKRHPDVLTPLVEATTPDYVRGRRRMPGNWPLLYLGFVLSGQVDMEPFWHRWSSSPLWAECGFAARPAYRTLYNNFVRLEDHADAFISAANELIRRARRHEPRIGRHVHYDGTSLHSHASLEHACPDKTACRRLGRSAAELAKANADEVRSERASEAKLPVDDAHKRGHGLRRLSVAEAEKLGLDAMHFSWFQQSSGHLYRCRDVDAGGRRYSTGSKRKRLYWVGGYLQPGIDDFIRTPLSVHVFGAHIQEWQAFPESFERTVEAIDDEPVAAIFDRGFVHKETFADLIRREVAPISPWREPIAGMRPADLETDEYDEDGTVRCRHCGGPTTQEGKGLGLVITKRGEPRLRVRCLIYDAGDACDRIQTMSAIKEPRLLSPISRRNRLPHALLAARDNMEGVFNDWRSRYKVAGNSLADRPKRTRTIRAQALRAAAALLLEWLRICLRHGWLGSHRRRNSNTPTERTGGRSEHEAVLATRLDRELDLPYRGDIAKLRARLRGSPPTTP